MPKIQRKLKRTMLRSIVGLSATQLCWLVAAKKLNARWQFHGKQIEPTKVKGEWVYLYRVVDNFGDTVVFMFSERRDEAVVMILSQQAIGSQRIPGKAIYRLFKRIIQNSLDSVLYSD